MKISATIPIVDILLSLSEPSSAGLARVLVMVIKAGIKAAETANDLSDAVNNDNSRRSFDVFPRVAIVDGTPKAQTNGKPSSHKNKNQHNQKDDAMAGLPQPAASLCEKQLKKVTVKFSVSKKNDVTIMNVPPACMTLATVFLGNNPDGGAPVPLDKSWSKRHLDVLVKLDPG